MFLPVAFFILLNSISKFAEEVAAGVIPCGWNPGWRIWMGSVAIPLHPGGYKYYAATVDSWF